MARSTLRGQRATASRISTIDAHAVGGAVRLLTGGIQVPRGRSPRARHASLARIAVPWRDALLCEPRGHPDTRLAVLAEPAAPVALGAHGGRATNSLRRPGPRAAGDHLFVIDPSDELTR